MKFYTIAPLILQKCIWIPCRIVFTLFGHLEVRGLENLKGIKSNVIFATNHASELDPFLVPTSLPFFSRFSPLFYITREKSFYDGNGWRQHLFGGLFINAWGGYSARTGLHDYHRSLVEHEQILRDGESFCVFPEGRRTPDGTLQPGKGGITFLAEQGRVPIIPVGFSGTYHSPAKDFFRGRKHITVTFGVPIYQEELKRLVPRATVPGTNVYKEESAYVMKKIAEILDVQSSA